VAGGTQCGDERAADGAGGASNKNAQAILQRLGGAAQGRLTSN
jgi:hypothetical protein